jgi:hypothetical protein
VINLKKPKLVRLYGVKEGNLMYVCTCGRLAQVPIKSFNKFVRCSVCTEVNNNLVSADKFTSDDDKMNLFDKMLRNGLYDFVSSISLGG